MQRFVNHNDRIKHRMTVLIGVQKAELKNLPDFCKYCFLSEHILHKTDDIKNNLENFKQNLRAACQQCSSQHDLQNLTISCFQLQ